VNQDKSTILVVDDESSIQESFSLVLGSDYNVLLAGTGEVALKKAADQKVDLVFLDIRMPGMDGIETLSRLKKISPQTEVVMVTAVYDVQKASQAIKYGARDYVVKPFDVDQILSIARAAVFKKGLLAAEACPRLLGSGEKIRKLAAAAKKIAEGDEWALILGEEGLEKEELARMIHCIRRGTSSGFLSVTAGSDRAEKIFGKEIVSTEELTRRGRTLTNLQTVFIDRIDRISPSFAKKLLSFRDDIRIIGGVVSDPSGSDFNRDLYQKFSLNILFVPPLRDRAGDLVELLEHYRTHYNNLYGKKTNLFSEDALSVLSLHPWPGNLTELKAVVSTAVLNQKEGEIAVSSLPIYILLAFRSLPFEDLYAEFEKELIDSVMKKNGFDKQKAAALLGIKPHVLESKLQ